MAYLFSGTHIISDFYEIKQKICAEEFLNIIHESCVRNNLTMLDSGVHVFENGGFTLYCLLAESHISMHYYIEEKSAFIDIFTCGKKNPEFVLKDLKQYCRPIKVNTHRIERGEKSA